MKRSAEILSLVLLLCVASAQAQETVEVTVKNFAGLERAIADANQRPADALTSITIVGRIDWPAAEPAFTVRRSVSISGGIFGEVGGDAYNLFIVESSGKLSVNSAEFVDISHAGFGPTIFWNDGQLVLENVRFESVAGAGNCHFGICNTPSGTAIIHNGANGKLTLNGVQFVDSGSNLPRDGGSTPEVQNGILANEGTAEVIRTQVYLSYNRWEELFFNSGTLSLQNSSFMVRNDPNVASLDLLVATDGAQTESVNSVFEGFTGKWCDLVVSLGHNTTSAADCTWAAPGDAVGTSTGLTWKPRSGIFNLIPSATSSIIDSADPSQCVDDGRGVFDGNGDGLAVCDRGAWEYRRTTLEDGGANGLYADSDPNHNGHYVYVLDNNYNTLVIWNTFDTAGNQAWIFAIGQLVGGRSMIADAYINENGVLTGSGPSDIDRDNPWGTIQLELDSCESGSFKFDSDLPGFTSGEFQIRRLAYVSQLGCDD